MATSGDLHPHNKAYARNNKPSWQQKIRICKHKTAKFMFNYYEKFIKNEKKNTVIS